MRTVMPCWYYKCIVVWCMYVRIRDCMYMYMCSIVHECTYIHVTLFMHMRISFTVRACISVNMYICRSGGHSVGQPVLRM